MKIGCFEVTYSPVTVKGKVKKVYMTHTSKNSSEWREAAYKEYRELKKASVRDSHLVVKKWLGKWKRTQEVP